MDTQSIFISVISTGFVFALIQTFFYLINRNRNLEDKISTKDSENSLLTAALINKKQSGQDAKLYFANPLSDRELQIGTLIVDGLINKEIADRLKISTNTVNNHIENMKEKTNCRSKAELVAYLLKNGIVD